MTRPPLQTFAARSLCGLLLLLSSAPTQAEPYTATLYEMGSNRSRPLFKLERTENLQGDHLQATIRFTAPGAPKNQADALVTEEVIYEKGNLSRYSIQSTLPPARGSLEIRDGKVWFKWEREGEKPDTDDEKMVDNLVIGPTLVPYLQRTENFEKLLRNEDVKVRFASLERTETVGFTLSRSRVFKEGERELLEIKMKATSFIIAAIVDPLYFTFDAKTRKALTIRGRTLPKRLVDGKWKDLDVDFIYD